MGLQWDENLAKVTAERGEEMCGAGSVLGKSASKSYKWLDELGAAAVCPSSEGQLFTVHRSTC